MYEEEEEDLNQEDLKVIIKNQKNFKKCMYELEQTESPEEREDILADVFAGFICNNLISKQENIEDYIS